MVVNFILLIANTAANINPSSYNNSSSTNTDDDITVENTSDINNRNIDNLLLEQRE